MVEMCHRMRKEPHDMALSYQNNPSEILLAKAKDKYDALNSSVVVVEEKYPKRQEDKP